MFVINDGTAKSGEKYYNLVLMKQVGDEHPWVLKEQNCLCIMAALEDVGATVLQASLENFATTGRWELSESPHISTEENSTYGKLVVFRVDDNNKLSFGKSKAKKLAVDFLADAVVENDVLVKMSFLDTVLELASNAKTPTKRKGGRPKKSGTSQDQSPQEVTSNPNVVENSPKVALMIGKSSKTVENDDLDVISQRLQAFEEVFMAMLEEVRDCKAKVDVLRTKPTAVATPDPVQMAKLFADFMATQKVA